MALKSGVTNREKELVIDNLDIFYKSLYLSRIRGIAMFDGDVETFSGSSNIIKELLKRDIWVNISGKINKDLEEEFVNSAGDGLVDFCDYLNISPVLNIDNQRDNWINEAYSELSEKCKCELKDLPIALIAGKEMDRDFIATVEKADDHIHQKRLNLNWNDRYHCSIFS